jgi:hypothetical protein
MRYTIEARDGYLRGELVDRQTPQETREFGEALHAAMRDKAVGRLLVVVRSSLPVFRVEEYQLSEFLNRMMAIPGAKIAVVSDSRELAAAHEYVQLIASQRGLALRAFSSEPAAIRWLARD